MIGLHRSILIVLILFKFLPYICLASSQATSLPFFGFQSVTIGGQRFAYYQDLTKTGTLSRQILIGPDFEQIAIDSDSDGTIDLFELRSGNLRITGKIPLNGRFSNLSIEQQFDHSLITTKLLLQDKSGSYQLSSIRKQKLSKLYKTIDGNNARCTDLNKPDQLAQQWQDLLKKLHLDGHLPIRSSLIAALKNNPGVFDSSCKNEPFASSFDKMVDGIADVMLPSSNETTSEPSFLRCLDKNGLSLLSARIQGTFISMLNKGPSDPSTAIICQTPESGAIAGKVGHWDVMKKQMSFYFENGKSIDRSLSKKIFAHEMSHHDRQLAETTVQLIEQCCIDQNQKTCAELISEVRPKTLYESYDAALAWSYDSYGSMKLDIEQRIGPDLTDALLAGFYGEMEKEKFLWLKRKSNCIADMGEDCDQECQLTCEQEMTDVIKRFTNNYFNSACPNKLNDKSTECSAIGNSFNNLISSRTASCGSASQSMPKPEGLFKLLIPQANATPSCGADFLTAIEHSQFILANPHSQVRIERLSESLTTRRQKRATSAGIDHGRDPTSNWNRPEQPQVIRTGSVEETRQDIAAQLDRSTVMVDSAARVLASVSDKIVPRAYARDTNDSFGHAGSESNRSRSASTVSRGRGQEKRASTELTGGQPSSTRFKSRAFAVKDPLGISQSGAPSPVAEVEVSTAKTEVSASQTRSPASMDSEGRGDLVAKKTLRAPSTAQGSEPGRSQSGSSSATTGGRLAQTSAAPAGNSATGKRLVYDDNRSDFQNRTELIGFLSRQSETLRERVSETNLSMALIKFKVQLLDENKSFLGGSRKSPEVKMIYSSKEKRFVEIGSGQ